MVLAAGGSATGVPATRYQSHTREYLTMSSPTNDDAALHLVVVLNTRERADRASSFS